MNSLRLNQIFENTLLASESEVTELKYLTEEYSYYALPFILLCKIYFQKEHYKFDEILHHTAIRVKDREWLYHYIREHNKITTIDNDVIENNFEIEIETIEEIVNLEDSPTNEILELEKNSIADFLDEPINKQIIKDELNKLKDIHLDNIKNEDFESEDFESESNEIEILEHQDSTTANASNKENETIFKADIFEEKEFSILDIAKEAFELNKLSSLRKHPIYKVDDLLTTENENFEKVDNFFTWLKHPKVNIVSNEFDDEEEKKIDEEKENIIDKFIAINPQISRPKKEFYSAENMAKRGEQMDWDFVTETLAQIYEEQGNKDMAIKAYEKLSLQNPMKKAYFASLIQKIKKEK